MTHLDTTEYRKIRKMDCHAQLIRTILRYRISLGSMPERRHCTFSFTEPNACIRRHGQWQYVRGQLGTLRNLIKTKRKNLP